MCVGPQADGRPRLLGLEPASESDSSAVGEPQTQPPPPGSSSLAPMEQLQDNSLLREKDLGAVLKLSSASVVEEARRQVLSQARSGFAEPLLLSCVSCLLRAVRLLPPSLPRRRLWGQVRPHFLPDQQ